MSVFRSVRRLAATALSLLAATAYAHDPGLSTAVLQFGEEELSADLTFARPDIETIVPIDVDRDGGVSPAEWAAAQPRLESLVRDLLDVRVDDRPLAPSAGTVRLDESNAVHFHLGFPALAGLRIAVRSPLIARLSLGHRQYLTMRDLQGNPHGERLLDARQNLLEVPVPRPGPSQARWRSVPQFLTLGVEHILTGYDHLAFLLALLLVGESLGYTLKIITSFTVAHSITLGLATVQAIQIAPRISEPLIALSILYVGLENVFRRHLDWRWMLTFVFGLVHGLGFATALRELGVGSNGGGVIVPLVSFNLGVEIGQLAIAAVVLPMIWRLRNQPRFVARYAPACSILIAIAGGHWLIQRMFGG